MAVGLISMGNRLELLQKGIILDDGRPVISGEHRVTMFS